MKQTNVFVHEYRTPVCKVVRVSMKTQLLQDSKYGVAGAAGVNVDVENDEYAY